MSDTVIRVENLAKKYVLGQQEEGSSYKTFRGAMTNAAKSFSNALNPRAKKEARATKGEFWALKDVSFEIKQGDRVGFIGRNGAGKSTLLKVLSRITEPTSGSIRIKGRVASLLEVGTGFHPELTGRENIFLNGAILGMSKVDIKRKFDEIVAFSEVEKFLDTPVKRYSSGMYVRLAFAVAAHLEPEILIVDEVLAVGDAQFQKKCLGKMEDVGKEGRTVLFVSHQMSAVESLCNRGILLQSGKLCLDDNPQKVINAYLDSAYTLAEKIPLNRRTDRKGNGKVKVSSFRVLNQEGDEQQALQSGKDYYFEIGYQSNLGNYLNNAIVSLDFYDEKNTRVIMLQNKFTNSQLTLDPKGGSIICGIKNLLLANGLYRIGIFISYGDSEILDWIEDAASICVDGGDFFGTGSPGLPSHCKVLVKAEWSSTESADSIFDYQKL
ncbi:ABC transporter ATP-binding protein [Scytonema sp. HK-05]|uniref:ABC transporter ATP-binding protein n=1 Tax=Scytonema sp. HK-05 TaxID=1137095 RepID=UPI0009362054|nr:ABC transporter ATP-binding protein [Scytonema sp. HK-05]OKH58244.1 ABC transporter ATP-binding protein [Scytonema sp. HK-05]BAY48376.1 ABC transporter ATP-binding protein [Scytonema sp. HK-05]